MTGLERTEFEIKNSIISKYLKVAPREVRSKRLTGEELAELEAMKSENLI
jgi:hypothetical protein